MSNSDILMICAAILTGDRERTPVELVDDFQQVLGELYSRGNLFEIREKRPKPALRN